MEGTGQSEENLILTIRVPQAITISTHSSTKNYHKMWSSGQS